MLYVAATCDEITESPLGRPCSARMSCCARRERRVPCVENRCAHGASAVHSRVDGRDWSADTRVYVDADGKCVYTPAQPSPDWDEKCACSRPRRATIIWIWLGSRPLPGSQPPRMHGSTTPRVDIRECLARERQRHDGYEHYLTSATPRVHREICLQGLRVMGAFNTWRLRRHRVIHRLLPELRCSWQADATGLDVRSRIRHREGGTSRPPAMHRQYWEIEAPDGKVYTTTRTDASRRKRKLHPCVHAVVAKLRKTAAR